MQLRNMVEFIQMHFPKIGRTQIVQDLDRALKQFSTETRILRVKVLLTSTDLVSRNYDLFETRYTMPGDTLEVTGVDAAYKGEYYLDQTTLVLRWVNEYVDEFYVEYIKAPATLTTDTQVPEMDAQFHMAIIYSVMENYAMSYMTSEGSIAQAAYWGKKYRELVRAAKIYVNKREVRV